MAWNACFERCCYDANATGMEMETETEAWSVSLSIVVGQSDIGAGEQPRADALSCEHGRRRAGGMDG